MMTSCDVGLLGALVRLIALYLPGEGMHLVRQVGQDQVLVEAEVSIEDQHHALLLE